MLSIFANNVSAQQNSSDKSTNAFDIQPNINAKSMFDTKTMTLGNNINNIKTLVILIPNESHHQEGEENETFFRSTFGSRQCGY